MTCAGRARREVARVAHPSCPDLALPAKGRISKTKNEKRKQHFYEGEHFLPCRWPPRGTRGGGKRRRGEGKAGRSGGD